LFNQSHNGPNKSAERGVNLGGLFSMPPYNCGSRVKDIQSGYVQKGQMTGGYTIKLLTSTGQRKLNVQPSYSQFIKPYPPVF
jgi:hypothetical protein